MTDCHIKINNIKSKVIVENPVLRQLISDALSFEVPGAEFSKIPGWDGRKRLLKKDNTFPTGLMATLLRFLRAEKVTFKASDYRHRPEPTESFKLDLEGKTPRYYQDDCAVISDTKPRGVFLMGTGAGKTLTSALVVARRQVQVLFITPDTGLREQVLEDYEKWFGKDNVSCDVKSNKPIIVANIQSLQTPIKKTPKIFERFNMLIVDEFHHAAASTYLDLNEACTNCYYRYGFTGTFLRSNGVDMIMHGVLSNVVYRKTTSELIEEGFLVRPYITIQEIKLPKNRLSYKEAYDMIAEHLPFNQEVAKIAKLKIAERKQTIILVRRKEHGRILQALLPGSEFVSGNDSKQVRAQIKKDFIAKKLRCMIATEIFGEGQDIPSIDVLINARAEKTEIKTKQGIGRALRKFPGKDKAEVFDFYFVGQRHLSQHSAERLNTYKSEPAFVLQIRKA